MITSSAHITSDGHVRIRQNRHLFGLGGIFHFKALCLGLASCFVFASMGTKRKTSQDSKPCFEKHISRVYLPIWNETWARPALRTLSRRSSKTFLAASLASAKRSKHVKALKALVLWTRSVTHSVTCHDAPPSHRPPPSGHQPPSTRKDTRPHDQRMWKDSTTTLWQRRLHSYTYWEITNTLRRAKRMPFALCRQTTPVVAHLVCHVSCRHRGTILSGSAWAVDTTDTSSYTAHTDTALQPSDSANTQQYPTIVE